MKTICFCGITGIGHEFEQTDKAAAWMRQPGIAIFAAPDSYGWRVIRVIELTGRDHDVRPVWALHDAERFGATEVFVSVSHDRVDRLRIVADIEAGLTPVLRQNDLGLGFAAAA